jgi:hypothetical protein
LVEKKTGFDGSRTLIQGGFCAWCRAGSIFAQDISNKGYNVKSALQKLNRWVPCPILQQDRVVRITSRTTPTIRFARRRHSPYDSRHESDPVDLSQSSYGYFTFATVTSDTLRRHTNRPNQSMEQTADRRENLFVTTSIFQSAAPLVLVSGRSALSR